MEEGSGGARAGGEAIEAVTADADEIRRRAEAAADLIRGDAERYAFQQRAAADRLFEQARRQLVLAEEEALARRSAAEREAMAIIGQAAQRARRESDTLLEHARRRLAEAVEVSRPTRLLPLIGRDDPLAPSVAATAAVIDLRSRTARPGTRSPMVSEPGSDNAADAEAGDRLGALVEEAVANAVRRTMHPAGVRAGRYI